MMDELQDILGYRFKDNELLTLALTHSSYKNELRLQFPHEKNLPDNERLEFLGDAILSFVITKNLFTLFDTKAEGELSKYRSILVSREQLFLIAKKMRLYRFIQMGKSEAHNTIKKNMKLISNCVESLIAAIYLDGGLKKSEEFIMRFWRPYLEQRKLTRLNRNYKSALQELTQKRHKILPLYHTVEKNGLFEATVKCGKNKKAQGQGKSKREAEQAAAKNLLKSLRT